MKKLTSLYAQQPHPMRWAAALLSSAALTLMTWSPASATTYQYDAAWAAANGNWDSSSNWQCNPGYAAFNCVPADSIGVSDTYLYDVTIGGVPGDVVTFDATAPTTIDELSLSSGETLQTDTNLNNQSLTIGDAASIYSNSGTLSNAGTISFSGGVLTVGASGGSSATITNTGTIDIWDSTLHVNGAFGQNSGVLNIENNSVASITGALTSSGTVNVTSASELLTGAMTTSGTVSVSADSLLQSSLFTISGGTANIAGTLSTPTFVQNGGTVTVQTGGAINAGTWDINGGTNNVQGQTITETPSSGTTTVGGRLNLQDGAALLIYGNLNVTGSVATGNGVSDTGSNLLSASQITMSTGAAISLNGSNDSLTTGSLTTSGTLVVNDGTSLVDNGNLNNSGNLTVTGCAAMGCYNTSANMTVDGTLTNTGDLTIGSEEAAKQAGVLDDNFVTLQDLQNVYNSGNVKNEAMDTLYFISEAVPGGDFWVSGIDAFGAMADPAPGTSAPTAPPVNFYNQNGGTVSLQASGEILAVTNGSFYNETGSTLTLSGGNDQLGAFSFVNGGTVKLESGGEEIVAPTIVNTGAMSIGSGDYVAVKTFDLGALGTVNATSYSQTAGATIVDGTLYSPAVDVSGGKLSGDGLIASLPDVVGGTPNPTVMSVTGGTVAPGDAGAPGTLTVDGSYTQGGDASLAIAIDGFGNFSVLDVLGSASLDGSVAFDFGFTPTAGDSFTFLTTTPGALSGMFSSESFSGFSCPYCTLAYNDSAGTVSLDVGSGPPAAAAEPGSMALFAAGLLAMGLSIGRKRRKSAQS